MKIKGTELLAKALVDEGVAYIFGYPGSYDMDLFDEIDRQGQLKIILPRHEQGLIHAADGYARSTGKVGVCLVTSGPGATNLVTGIATANYDSVPLVCLTGQVPTSLIGNDAFQEVDIVGITRSISKYGITVKNREELGRTIKEAFYIAQTGRPGPVIIDLPKDIMLEPGPSDYPQQIAIRGYQPVKMTHGGQIKKAADLIACAERPLFLIGGGIRIANAEKEMEALADRTQIPVITTLMGKGAIPAKHPMHVGIIGMHGDYSANMAAMECDCLISIGTRFNDRITGKVDAFAPKAKIIHIDIDPASISKNVLVDIPIVADAKAAIGLLNNSCGRSNCLNWLENIRQWKCTKKDCDIPNDFMNPSNILHYIQQCFNEDTIFTTDVGQHQMWSAQSLQINQSKRFITSGGLGTMGFGMPSAIGAQLGNPGKRVVCITGDGGMQMNIQELATATAYELPIVVCIFNNGYLGMVRQWQQLFYQERYVGTCLRKRKSCEGNCGKSGYACPPYVPDFIKLAESYGAQGKRVEHYDDAKKAMELAVCNTKTPTVIEWIIDSKELVLPMVKGGTPLTDMIVTQGGL